MTTNYMLIIVVVRGSIIFAERVVGPWNSSPRAIDFNTVNSFKRSIHTVDFSKFLCMIFDV